jgi:hypothetical protein
MDWTDRYRHFGMLGPGHFRLGNPACDDVTELGWLVTLALDDEAMGFGPFFDALVDEDSATWPGPATAP